MTHRAGTIGLVSTGGFAGKAIRLATEGHWNHVVIAKGDGQVYSAEPRSGVCLRAEDAWSDTAWLVNEPFTDSQGAARVAFCEGKLHTPYNWPAVLTFSRYWFYLPTWFIKWANCRPSVICSELAVLASNAGGSDTFGDQPPATVAPAEIDVGFRRKGW